LGKLHDADQALCSEAVTGAVDGDHTVILGLSKATRSLPQKSVAPDERGNFLTWGGKGQLAMETQVPQSHRHVYRDGA